MIGSISLSTPRSFSKMKRQHSKALRDAKAEKTAPPPKKAKKDSKSAASYGADCAPEVPAADEARDKAFADSLVALAPDLGLVAKKAFGHLGLQRGITFPIYFVMFLRINIFFVLPRSYVGLSSLSLLLFPFSSNFFRRSMRTPKLPLRSV
jgi:hypothetical protein